MAERQCPKCGKWVSGENSFCVYCGTSLDAQPVPAQISPEQMASSQTKSPFRSKRPLVIGIAAAVAIVVIAIILAVVFLGSSGESSGSRQSSSTNANSSAAPEPDTSVNLTKTYTTTWPDYAHITYPAFSFAYPDGWEITNQEVDQMGEEVTISKIGAEGVSVTYVFSTQPVAGGRIAISSIHKAADSDFAPSMVQATDLSSLGTFMVADATFDGYIPTTNEAMSGEAYVVLPESALQPGNPGFESMALTPYFNYAGCVSFSSSQVEAMDESARNEAIAILSSFTTGTAKTGIVNPQGAASQNSTASNGSIEIYPPSSVGADGYILPQSVSQYLTEADLNGVDLYTLYLARNEIFARHGRQFKKQELQDYFNSKSWYHGTIPAEQFTDSMISDIEKKNSELMYQIEQMRNSPYIG